MTWKKLKLADVHRLPQHPVTKKGVKVVRPVITKLTNAFDKHLIFSSLKHLKTYNENCKFKLKTPNYVFVTEHLPRGLQIQKKRLLPLYNEPKQQGQKTSWKIVSGEYQLYSLKELELS